MSAHLKELIEVGRFFDEKGWVPATSGNLSVRLGGGRFAVTSSGRHLGELQADHFLVVNAQGERIEGSGRPSAETALHLQVYDMDPSANAVVHTHSPRATMLSYGTDSIDFEGLEILKAFPSITSHECRVQVPVVPNSQDMADIGQSIQGRELSIPGFLIAGHGLYTWGDSVKAARVHAEAFEFLFNCHMLRSSQQG